MTFFVLRSARLFESVPWKSMTCGPTELVNLSDYVDCTGSQSPKCQRGLPRHETPDYTPAELPRRFALRTGGRGKRSSGVSPEVFATKDRRQPCFKFSFPMAA